MRAGIAQRLEDCDHTSLALRLRRGTNATEALRPLASGLADHGVPATRLENAFGDYTNGASAPLAEHLERQRFRGEPPPQSRGDDA